MVPGVSLAQLCHAARAADPATPYGLSLRTSLLASIVHSGALSNMWTSQGTDVAYAQSFIIVLFEEDQRNLIHRLL